ncbi:MAG: 2Fe-2S iron-sulfur cluster-binding protein [Candidatus Humimicrobiaceae bacterium]
MEDNNKINMVINDEPVTVEKGNTILEAARNLGIDIPTICHHEALKEHGSCRLCMVEIKRKGKSKIVASCAYPAEEGLAVYTDSSKVESIRKKLVELYLALFPFIPEVKELAKKYNLTGTRYTKQNNYCILCGLCVRYCSEVKKNNAIGFVGRGIDKMVTFVPDSSYFKHCENCMECVDICPTGVFPSNYGLERIPQLSED